MSEDGEPGILIFDNVQKLLSGGAELGFVVIGGPGFAVDGEETFEDDSVDGEQDRAGFWKPDEDRLVAGAMARGFKNSDTGEDCFVAIDLAVTGPGEVPVGAGRGKARVAAASECEMRSLDDKFGTGESVVVAAVVEIKVRGDDGVDSAGTEIQIGEMFEDGFFVFWRGEIGRERNVTGHAGIDKDMFAVIGSDEIGGGGHFQSAAGSDGKAGGRKLEKIEFLGDGVWRVHRSSFRVRDYWQAKERLASGTEAVMRMHRGSAEWLEHLL